MPLQFSRYGGRRPFRVILDVKMDNATMPSQPDPLILKLIEKLSDANPLTRRNAAGALRLQGRRAIDALPAITVLLADQDPRVRNEAERAIDHLRLVAA